MKSHRTISLGLLFAGVLGVVFFLFSRGRVFNTDASGEQGPGASKSEAAAGPADIRRPRSSRSEETETVDRASPAIFAAEQKLRDMENKRFSFTKQYEDEEKVGFEFRLAAPGKEEQLEISRISSEIKGLVPQVRPGVPQTWAAKLREDYLYESEYEEFEVTVFFYKESGEGSYVVNGKKRGAGEGFDHAIRSAPEFGENSRFSYLLNFDQKQEKDVSGDSR